MKVIGVIPARYASSRFPGKPLADICGKPMIWWVYYQAKKVNDLSDIVVAVDNQAVYDECRRWDIPCIETSSEHPTHMHRLLEVAQKYPADVYVCICGDEPLIEPEVIQAIIPQANEELPPILVRGIYRELSSPTETMDSGNIKIIVDEQGQALALSRTAIPNPYKTIEFAYHKTIGIECFNKAALEFYVNTSKGTWERVEDIMMLRFVEHHIPAFFTKVSSKSLSVDTEKDLEHIRKVIQKDVLGVCVSEYTVT